jgi:hypothetical protein
MREAIPLRANVIGKPFDEEVSIYFEGVRL